MVSMVETSNPAQNDEAMDTVMPKSEPMLEGSISESVSEAEGETLTQDVAQTQKRKGGRKPIYATSEERKQRNRQAQAAFRERRTEYIRQLETTIKRNEEALQTLQQNHRSAADECLMLRYKNSLLERLLLEKGIDVQAELRLKSSGGGPVKPNPMMSKHSTVERAGVNRAPSQRHPVGIAPKEHFGVSQPSAPSPQFQPTPTSHISSPSHTKSPGFAIQGVMSPVDHGQTQQARSQVFPQSRTSSDPQPNVPGSAGSRPGVSAAYYPSPFQKHYDQLEQEYDAQADLVDEGHDSVDDTAQYIPGLNQASVPPGSNGAYSNTNHLLGNYDPMLDTDPFGLSASMHFQTPFSYEQNHTRH